MNSTNDLDATRDSTLRRVLWRPRPLERPRHQPALRRRHTVGGVAVFGAAVLGLGVLATPSTPADAATRVPTFSLTPRAFDLDPGTSAEVAVQLGSTRPSSLRATFRGLPPDVSPSLRCIASRACVITFDAARTAGPSTSLVDVTLRAGSSARTASLALHVNAPPATTAPPAPPTTTTPTTAPTTTPPTTTSPRTLGLRLASTTATARPGARATFAIELVRNGWTDPVSLSLDSLPPAWGAAFLPNPSSANATTLIVDAPSGATVGDYPLRVTGRAGSTSADVSLTVRLRNPELSLSLVSQPSTTPSATTRYVLDVRSLDDPSLPVSLRADGLPAGVAVAFSSNPAIGTVNADVSLGVALTPGTYPFEFVAFRNGVEKRLATSLSVVASGSGVGAASISFTPTPVTAVPGEALSYGLQSSSGAFTVARGGTFPIDVQVQPHGGFAAPIAMTLSTPAGWLVTASSIGSNTVRFVVTVPSTSAAGATTLQLTTSSGSLAASLTFAVTVT